MTTVVYDHESKRIACDSRFTANDVILSDDARKWKQKEDGSVWFFCGNNSDFKDLIKISHNEKPDVIPDCNAIYAKDGKAFLVTFSGNFCSHTELEYNHAIGSGWKFALAGLDFSLETDEAVKYTAKRDCYTGGEIRVYNVAKMRFE